MNGRPARRLDAALPIKLLRYCTQSVMALPLEILAASRLLAAEHASKRTMCVYATSCNVHVVKELRVAINNRWVPIEINVHADVYDPVAVITFRFGTASSDRTSSLIPDLIHAPMPPADLPCSSALHAS